MKKILNQKGVALMMVLSSLLIITTLVFEFAFNTHVAYEVAAAQRDKLKARYLAESALNLLRLELRLEKQLRQQFAPIIEQLTGGEITADPFCKMVPLSTNFVQGLATGAFLGAEPTEETSEEEPAEKKPPDEESEASERSELFDFEGEFEGVCDSEERKINLNAFYQNQGAPPTGTPPPTGNIYFDQMNLLYALLSQPSYEKFFEDSDDIQKLVHRIADWADADSVINESPGVNGGYEDSEYSTLSYKPKNGKYGSKAELLLIPGLGDQLYRLLEPHVTVFGDNRINLCQADQETVLAFLDYYSRTTAGANAFNPNDEVRNQPLLTAIKDACKAPTPQPAQIAGAITSYLGGDGSTNLANRISTENRFYSLKATGTSGEIKVTLSAVYDTQNSNPNLWKTLYFRVE